LPILAASTRWKRWESGSGFGRLRTNPERRRNVKTDNADWRRREAHLGRARAFAKSGRDEDARRELDEARQIDSPLALELAQKLFPGEYD
jgi:hypothetical protein